LRFPQLCVAWQPDLPAGIRQADCDGPENELADSDGNRLWTACDACRQESMSVRFVQLNLEQLRDALLDTQDAFALAAASSNGTPGASLGRWVWTMWISYRDRVLREMVRRGDLSTI
jgi:hypothetical protein